MVDLTKPCVKCGAVNRYKSGACKVCVKNQKRIWRRKHTAGLLNKPCVKCGKAERYLNGDCIPCERNRRRIAGSLNKPCVKCGKAERYLNGGCRPCNINKKRISGLLNQPCVKCGAGDRWKSGACKVCEKNRNSKYRKTNEYRQNKRKHIYKAKRNNFEFSLQNQQKAIEQCQQKLKQPSEIS